MPSPAEEISLTLVADDTVAEAGDERDKALPDQIAAVERQIVDLERELLAIDEQEAETLRHLESQRTSRSALEEGLRTARKEEAQLRLEATSAARDTIISDAEREAADITKRAAREAEAMLSEAEKESAVVLEQGRERIRALEEDAARRAIELDTEHRELTMELQVMKTLFDELQATLKLVAETSIKELVEAKSSLAQIDQGNSPRPSKPRRRAADGRPARTPPGQDR